MKISFDARLATWGGIGSYSVGMLRALGALRTAGDFELLGLRTPADGFLEDFPEVSDIDWAVLKGNPWTPSGALAAGLAARGRADVYHANHVTLPLGFDGSLVTTIHDLIPLVHPESMPSFIKRGFFRFAVEQAVARSEVVLTDSRFTAEMLYGMGLPPRRLRVVHLAVEERFQPQPRAEVDRVLAKYRLAEDYVLWLGAFKPHKNVRTLIDGYRLLPADLRRRHSLVLGGDAGTVHAGELREEVGRLGLETQIRFIGRVGAEDLPGLYSGSAVFVFPSLIEGFGLPPLEAAACRVPVIASALPPMPEVLGRLASYVDARSAPSISAALVALLTDSRLAGPRSRQTRPAGIPTWSQVAEEAITVYRTAAISAGKSHLQRGARWR